MQLSEKSQKTVEKLIAKANSRMFDKTRMPSLKAIAELLSELGVEYTLNESQNFYKTGSQMGGKISTYNSGKKGQKLEVGGLELDTSDSYYSSNVWQYAQKILRLLEIEY